jgi:hypothetical protein
MITCSRCWEAEAVRDGRLTGSEARSFLRHAASCAPCSRQVRELDRLGASLRALPPPPRDALTVRRSRRAILQRLDEQTLRPEPSRLVRPLLWSAGLAAAAALGFWLRSPSSLPSSLPTREMQADRGITAPRSPAPAPEPVALADARPSPSAPAPSLPLVAAPAQVSSPVPRGLHPAAPALASALAPAAPSAAPAAPAEDTQATEFEQAMEHFRAGRLGAASALFDAFASSHPGDARAEDAAYLRVVALARSNQREAARQAAASYLARYPGGLRAKEVQNLVR